MPSQPTNTHPTKMQLNPPRAGEAMIYCVTKRGTHPGPRAKQIRPEPKGDAYLYDVDKFWTVTENRGQRLVLMTRRGKVHEVEIDDPHLRRANWWEKLIYRRRFPKLPNSDPATSA